MAKLMLVDDHPLFLDGISRFLAANDHVVACTARSAAEALQLVADHSPEVMILDVSMKDGTGVDVLAEIRARGCNIPIIFMTVSIDPAATVEALKYGINGIVLKDSEPAELLRAIELVLEGQTSIDPKVSEKALFYSISGAKSASSGEELLTEREREIAALVRDGLRNSEIALRCGLTDGTVKVHLHNIFQKLGVKSRAELIARTLRDLSEKSRAAGG
jgi:two-component system nitrate/nitrite response regulator NarP